MTQTETICRHPDGSIDFDFYRAGATALRRQALRDSRVLRRGWLGTFAVAGALAWVTVIAAMPWRSVDVVASGVLPAAKHPTYCAYPGASGAPSSPCWLVRAPAQSASGVASISDRDPRRGL